MEKTTDIFGIGCPMIDTIALLTPGQMRSLPFQDDYQILTRTQLEELLRLLPPESVKRVPGDSTANTLSTLSQLGCSASFLGCAGSDAEADEFIKDLHARNITSHITQTNGKTAQIVSLVGANGERKFAAYLGACTDLLAEHIPHDAIARSRILHATGYQLSTSPLKDTTLACIAHAHTNDTLVSLDLADPSVIRENLAEYRRISKTYADILFVNEHEAHAFTGKNTAEEQIHDLSGYADLVILKRGAYGALIHHQGTLYTIASVPTRVIDTTGAGDSYAAGILYGALKKIPMDRAGQLAATIAAQVVAQQGARLSSVNIPPSLLR